MRIKYVEDSPELDRLLALYAQGHTQAEMAEDAVLVGTLLAAYSTHCSRRGQISFIMNELRASGRLDDASASRLDPIALEAPEGLPCDAPTGLFTAPEIDPAPAPLSSSEMGSFDRYVRFYEELIDAPPRKKSPKPVSTENTVVFSDFHNPDLRDDLLAEALAAHRGAACVVAGDINSFDQFSAFTRTEVALPDIRETMAKTDALMQLLAENFSSVTLLLGNHDLRLPRMVGKVLHSADYYWLTSQFLFQAYERRHGVQVVRNTMEKANGGQVETYHWHQIGDCMISHLECYGKVQGRGAEAAHNFFYSFRDEIPLAPFKLVLQAHTHRQSFFRHPLTRIVCCEIGAMCDNQAYQFHSGKSAPVEHGYFYLVQRDGKTDFSESRLVLLDD